MRSLRSNLFWSAFVTRTRCGNPSPWPHSYPEWTTHQHQSLGCERPLVPSMTIRCRIPSSIIPTTPRPDQGLKMKRLRMCLDWWKILNYRFSWVLSITKMRNFKRKGHKCILCTGKVSVSGVEGNLPSYFIRQRDFLWNHAFVSHWFVLFRSREAEVLNEHWETKCQFMTYRCHGVNIKLPRAWNKQSSGGRQMSDGTIWNLWWIVDVD